MHISIIVPVYNEATCLEKNIKIFVDYLEKQTYDYELIIVNDGSVDDTSQIAKQLQRDYSQVSLIDNNINKGKGAVVKQGFLVANGDYKLFLDADNATSIDHLDKVWTLFDKDYDIVIGSRNPKDAPGAEQIKMQAGWKRIIGKCGNILIQMFLVWGIWDTQCGFKVFTQDSLQKIIPRLSINRWLFDAEILTIANKQNLKIGKIPVSWKNADITRVSISGYLNSLREILKIAYNKITGKYS